MSHHIKRMFAPLPVAVAVLAAAALVVPSASVTPAVAAPTAAAAPAAVAALPWMDTSLPDEERARLLVDAMTLAQKIQQMQNRPVPNKISGTYLAEGGVPSKCDFQSIGRHVEGIPALGIPTLREVNGGNGVRGGDCVREPIKTAGPSMTAAAASFNPQATQRWGEVVGGESVSFAHQVLLGPGLNLIRSPFAGRAQEYPGEDPYLAGVIGSAQVKGIQSQGAQTMIKHFAGNEHEYQMERWTAASRIPPRAMHELYLLPFEMTVRDAKPAAVMCAYPHLNLDWACESEGLLKETLRDRWGFKGWIESDRRAMHSTADSLLAGVGYELDSGPVQYTNKKILDALTKGEIVEKDIDDVLRPRYAQMIKFGNFDKPLEAFAADDLSTNARKQQHLAEESITLLKNEKGMLPIGKDVKTIALIGPQWFAGQASIAPRNFGDPNNITGVVAPYTVTPLQGLQREVRRMGSSAVVTYNDGTDTQAAVKLASKVDVVIMMFGTNPREGVDLKKANLPVVNGVNQHDLAWAVTKANPRNVVVLKTAAGVTMNWSNRARAIVAAWFPGQDDGDVVAGVLFGRTNPSGKTPVSWPQTGREAGFATERQYPGVKEFTGIPGGPGREGDPKKPQLVNYYDEGLAMGYRWYEKNDVKPKYAFGHGLSYTSFEYSNLSLWQKVGKGKEATIRAQFKVKNTGKVAGKEVSQVYLTLPNAAGQPSKRLVGFSKTMIKPGQTATIRVVINTNSSSHPFSYWVPAVEPASLSAPELAQWADGDWKTATGKYTVHVGGASDDTPLSKSVQLTF